LAAVPKDLLKPGDDRLRRGSASLLDGGSRIRLLDTRDIHCVTPFWPVAIRLRSGSRATGALVLDWNRQVTRRRERFLSPRVYRLLEISPAFNEIRLQKSQNAAILLVVSFAG
jgi:hypothetical protein